MDCSTARLLVAFSGPRAAELQGDEAEALAAHLADCPDCAAIHQAERKIDERLGRAMRDVPLPPGLRERLVTNLAAERWASQRRKLVRAFAGIAAAIALALGWYFWPRPPLPINFPDRHQMVNAADLPSSAQEVVDHFARQGVVVQMPTDINLNYNRLTYCDWGELEGQRVPLLIFQNGSATLRVYILDGKRFDLGPWAGNQLSGKVTLELRVSADGRFGWLFEYTGDSLKPFEARDVPPAA
jgi:hypothetical protein